MKNSWDGVVTSYNYDEDNAVYSTDYGFALKPLNCNGRDLDEHIEYTPYGELWVEETGLYYYGGLAETTGASGGGGFLSIGGDVNIPIDGPKKNFSVTFNIGLSAGCGEIKVEAHAFTTTTTINVYGEGHSFIEAWNDAIESGMFDEIGQDIIDHFKKAYQQQMGKDQ